MREYISKEDTIKAIDRVIYEASTTREANAMFKIKSVIYSQNVIKLPAEHWTGCPCCLARMGGGEEK